MMVSSLAGLSNPAFAAEVPESRPDMGLVVFFREKKAKGAALRFRISDTSAQSIGTLTNGSMIHIYLPPGQHSFTARNPSVDGTDVMTLNVEAGETYYVQGEFLWGWPTGRPKFNRVSESQALPSIKKL